ncbi:c6 transcription [Emericellopsis cladophorae]|uniref:C6 transcription n=1 Tax=Emericellopsis cladophorae TaxID=2686198 RepID=A0A9P9Y4F3_9HYPO|nr:c6 transcription [Emericellopsis cladophorae]KAI6782910.1 c6 transcription [Emericellopsis cladophorae]
MDHTSLDEGNFTFEGPSAGTRDKEDDSDLVPLPMNNLYNLTDPNNSRLIRVDPAAVNGPDLIRQGVIKLAEAEFLFNH